MEGLYTKARFETLEAQVRALENANLSLLDKVERAEAELDRAGRETDSLLNALVMREQIKQKVPQWEPLDTVGGRISQINNIVAGIYQDKERAEAERDLLRDADTGSTAPVVRLLKEREKGGNDAGL